MRMVNGWTPRVSLRLAVLILAMSAGPGFADTVKIGGDGGALTVMRLLEEAFTKENQMARLSFVQGLTSGGVRKAFPDKVIDIGVTSTAGNDKESLPGAREYGKSPFIFVTAPSTRVYNLDTNELLDIYNGTMIRWPTGERLRLILRPQTDADTRVLKRISPAVENAVMVAHSRRGIRMAMSDVENADAITATPGGFGTTTLALVVATRRPLNILSIDGKIPSPRSIGDGTYNWFKTYYIAARPDASPVAKQFVEFVFSPKGREILTSIGHSTSE